MPTFGKRSATNLAQADEDLQRLMHEAIKHTDFTVIQGYRSPADQQKAYDEGHSKAKPGQSPHNFLPALAVDVIPYPEGFQATQARWDELGAVILDCAKRLKIGVTWGKTFKTLVDQPHFELTDWRDRAKKRK